MYYIWILKASYYMDYGVAFTDICKKLVAETLALGGALYESGYIHEFDDCRSYLF